MDSVCLDFGKVLDTVSYKILIDKLLLQQLDEQTARWIEFCHNGQVQRVVSGTKSSWRSVH